MIKIVIIASVVVLSLTSLSVLAGEKIVEAKVGPVQAFQKDAWGGTPPQEHELSLGLAANEKASGRAPASVDDENTAGVGAVPANDPLAAVAETVMNEPSDKSKTSKCMNLLSEQLSACKHEPQNRSSEKLLVKCADQKIAAYKSCLK